MRIHISTYIIRNMVDSLATTKGDNYESLRKLKVFREEIKNVSNFIERHEKFYENRV